MKKEEQRKKEKIQTTERICGSLLPLHLFKLLTWLMERSAKPPFFSFCKYKEPHCCIFSLLDHLPHLKLVSQWTHSDSLPWCQSRIRHPVCYLNPECDGSPDCLFHIIFQTSESEKVYRMQSMERGGPFWICAFRLNYAFCLNFAQPSVKRFPSHSPQERRYIKDSIISWQSRSQFKKGSAANLKI